MPTRLYVGNLGKDRSVDRHDLEDLFGKYGQVVDVWVARQPPGFAFVTLSDEQDAKDAVKELDGSKFQGERIRVQVSTRGDGAGGGGGGGRGRDDRDGGRRDRSRSRGRRDSRSPSRKRHKRRSKRSHSRESRSSPSPRRR